MREQGQVTEVQNDGIVTVKIPRTTACDGCRACGLGNSDKKFILIKAYNVENAKEGDFVEVDLDDSNFFLATVIMYGLPLLTLLTTVILSYYVIAKNNEMIAVTAGLIVMAITFFIIKKNEEKLKKSKRFMPKIKLVK